MSDTDTLVAVLTRDVTMSWKPRRAQASVTQQVPAGTEVYVGRETGPGFVEVRVCGSLLSQSVSWRSLTAA